MVCANSVRTGIRIGQFHRSLLVRRLLTRLGGSAKRQRLLDSLADLPVVGSGGQSPAQLRSRVCGHLRADVRGSLGAPLRGPLRCGSATPSRLQAAAVIRIARSDAVAAMIHPSLQAATEVLLESHVRCRASAASVRSVHCKRVSSVRDRSGICGNTRSPIAPSTWRRSAPAEIGRAGGGDSAWRRPESLPPAVRWRAAAASPPWPGDGEARGCEDAGWDSGFGVATSQVRSAEARAGRGWKRRPPPHRTALVTPGPASGQAGLS